MGAPPPPITNLMGFLFGKLPIKCQDSWDASIMSVGNLFIYLLLLLLLLLKFPPLVPIVFVTSMHFVKCIHHSNLI